MSPSWPLLRWLVLHSMGYPEPCGMCLRTVHSGDERGKPLSSKVAPQMLLSLNFWVHMPECWYWLVLQTHIDVKAALGQKARFREEMGVDIDIIRNWLMWLCWEVPWSAICKLETRRANCVVLVQVQRPKNQESQWCMFQSECRRRPVTQLKNYKMEGVNSLVFCLFCSIQALNRLDEAQYLLYSVYQFKC